jgi:hypothetical protein
MRIFLIFPGTWTRCKPNPFRYLRADAGEACEDIELFTRKGFTGIGREALYCNEFDERVARQQLCKHGPTRSNRGSCVFRVSGNVTQQ